MTTKIYHNPRCSKSRATLQLLKDHQIKVDVIEYLKTPPKAVELADILTMLGLTARELMRKKEAEYRTVGADNPMLTEAELIDLMVAHPKLIERPIVVKDGDAIIGRPPENVLRMI